jgi:hypothetical protein
MRKRKEDDEEKRKLENYLKKENLKKIQQETEEVKEVKIVKKREKKRINFYSKISTDKTDPERLLELVKVVSKHEMEKNESTNNEKFKLATKSIFEKFLKDVEHFIQEEEKPKIKKNEMNEYLLVQEKTQEVILNKLKREEEEWILFEKEMKEKKQEVIEKEVVVIESTTKLESDSSYSLGEKVQQGLDQIPMKIDQMAVFTHEIHNLFSKVEKFAKISQKNLNSKLFTNQLGNDDIKQMIQELGE